jgi:hypothetical protein
MVRYLQRDEPNLRFRGNPSRSETCTSTDPLTISSGFPSLSVPSHLGCAAKRHAITVNVVNPWGGACVCGILSCNHPLPYHTFYSSLPSEAQFLLSFCDFDITQAAIYERELVGLSIGFQWIPYQGNELSIPLPYY